MSKQHKIKWKEQDLKDISRVVKNYNAKITRLAKKNPIDATVLPEKITVKELKALINTRQDLKREINSLQRFSKRGAEKIVDVPDSEYNLKITKWQMTEMNRRVGIINRKRKERLDKIQSTEMTSRGENLGYTRGQLGMGRATEVALEPMNAFYRTMGNTDLKKRWKSILNQSQSDFLTRRDYLVRENYLKGLKENYNVNDIKDIIESIENMDIMEFLRIFESEGGTFEFAYPGRGLESEFISALRTTWVPNN